MGILSAPFAAISRQVARATARSSAKVQKRQLEAAGGRGQLSLVGDDDFGKRQTGHSWRGRNGIDPRGALCFEQSARRQDCPNPA
jgi:hypothetical protein